jgi:virginiamycin B lyase
MMRVRAHAWGTNRVVPALVIVSAVFAVAAYGWLTVSRGTAEQRLEYRVLDAQDIPAAVAIAPDGAVWFTLESSDSLGILRDGHMRKLSRGSESLEALGLAADAHGGAWFTDIAGQSIGHLDSNGTRDAVRVPGPLAQLGRLAIAPDGAVWFADSWSNSITRLQDGRLVTYPALEPNAAPFGVAVERNGTVWATLQVANKLVRIDPDGTYAEIDLPTRNATPADVAVDDSGGVWLTELRANKLARYREGRFDEFAAPGEAAGLTSLAVAPDGSVWFTELRQQKLARLRDGSIAEFPLPRPEARPFGVAVDASGNVWYTDLSGWVGKLPGYQAQADRLDLGRMLARSRS